MTTSFRRPAALLILAAACAAPASSFALHRCTAADGKVTYTEFPCDTGSKASGVEIHDSAGMEVNKRTNNFSHSSKKSTTSTPAAAPQKAATDTSDAERKNRCRQAQNNNRVLNTPAPVYSVGDKGKKNYLDDTQRDAAIQRQSTEIADNCR